MKNSKRLICTFTVILYATHCLAATVSRNGYIKGSFRGLQFYGDFYQCDIYRRNDEVECSGETGAILKELRAELKHLQLDAYIVPMNDAHQVRNIFSYNLN